MKGLLKRIERLERMCGLGGEETRIPDGSPVSALEPLSVRAINALSFAGIKTCDEAWARLDDLLRSRGVGRATVREIKTALAGRQLYLRIRNGERAP